MITEEYGKENSQTIVMLHGAHFVHAFGRQYALAKKYHIIVVHIMGFGYHTENVFETDACIQELAAFIQTLPKKVWLVGFSLGAQLAYKLVSEHEELFEGAIIVSPWLIKEEPMLSEIYALNLKQFHALQNRFLCGFTAVMNGLPPKQCKEFVLQMQNVKEETVRNLVYNGITLGSVPAFSNISIPVMALAGARESRELTDSVKKMSEMNAHCRYEIWEKAAHNIPPLFAGRFNQLICDFITENTVPTGEYGTPNRKNGEAQK
ncbi:MAG: alpha/beta hydrolase [Eubacteriales bacterium]|nr:alpha/beta hydrolase [Eubacteriales bacterium]